MDVFKSLAFACLVSCSLLTDSSLDSLRCEGEAGVCRTGYSCLYDVCVRDKSQPAGNTCSQTSQCQEGLFCPAGIPVCASACSKVYSRDSECGPNAVCVPVPDRDNNGKFSGGACVPAECSLDTAGDQACQTDGGLLAPKNAANGCIRLARDGGMCLLRCTVGIRKANSSSGEDLCISDRRFNPTHCGRVADGDNICVPAGGLLEGEACTLFPEADSVPPDTCGLNVMGTTPGLPLLCLDRDGGVSGKLRCRIAACERDDQCPANQTCVNENNLRFCRGATEQ